MTRLCHLFDETAGWQQRVGVSQLLDRLDHGDFVQDLAVLGRDRTGVVGSLDRGYQRVMRIGPLDFVSAPLLRGLLDRGGTGVVHAWGAPAARVAAAATDRPILLELFEPADARRDAKIIRSIRRSIGFGVVCGSERLRRLLTENGVPLELSTVVRPGVDFSWINKVHSSGLRDALGLSRDDFVVLVPPLHARGDGRFESAVAVTLLSYVEPRARLLLAVDGDGAQWILRYARRMIGERVVGCSTRTYPLEQLVAIADTMVLAPKGEVATTVIAWAMASGTAVVGPAVYSVAELIGSGLNGVLYKPPSDRSPAFIIARLLCDRAKQERAREVARGHAYEVFGLRRRVDQIVQVYRNLQSGKPAGDGISDSAVAG